MATRQKNLRRTFRHQLDWEVVLVAMAFFIAPNVHIFIRGERREAIESSVYSTISFLVLRLMFFVIRWIVINYKVRSRARKVYRLK